MRHVIWQQCALEQDLISIRNKCTSWGLNTEITHICIKVGTRHYVPSMGEEHRFPQGLISLSDVHFPPQNRKLYTQSYRLNTLINLGVEWSQTNTRIHSTLNSTRFKVKIKRDFRELTGRHVLISGLLRSSWLSKMTSDVSRKTGSCLNYDSDSDLAKQ